ncbi:MAG TPA: hypothetical protein VFM88_08160 [Vicinamibacteria bacterium]|nr:hypothetical protein [Vicinamibacteria bacterium]
MARVRGRDFIDALAFVRETYGAEAVERAVSRLGAPERSRFEAAFREVEWYPLDLLVAFLRAAQAALAPGDPTFFERQGRYAAQRQKESFLSVMVGSAEARVATAPTIWRMFYDVGRLEVVGEDPVTAVSRIHDFPATPELCRRFRGIWEGMASTPAHPAAAEETRCVLRGDPFCEFSLSHEA